jgi:hypothetical protein
MGWVLWSCLGRALLPGIDLWYPSVGDCVGHRAGMDTEAGGNILWLPGSNPGRPVCSQTLHYPSSRDQELLISWASESDINGGPAKRSQQPVVALADTLQSCLPRGDPFLFHTCLLLVLQKVLWCVAWFLWMVIGRYSVMNVQRIAPPAITRVLVVSVVVIKGGCKIYLYPGEWA